jgi:HEAT repeat protein
MAGSCVTSADVTHATIEASLNALFAAEREGRKIHDELAASSHTALYAAITKSIADAKQEEDAEEASLRLVCLARLLGELEGPEVVDALIDVLDADLPEARSEAGEQLQGLAFDRFKEVALGVERALARLGEGSPALVELPYLLHDIPEGGVVKLLGKFLQHADADAVAAAIETLVLLGDPAATKLLLPLQGDKRVSVIGEDEEQTQVTVGDLAIEAIELLRQAEET